MKNRISLLPALAIGAAVLALASILVFMLANMRSISDNNREYLLDNTNQMAILCNDAILNGLTNIRVLSRLIGSMLVSPTVDVVALRGILDNSLFDFIEFVDKDGNNHNTTGGVSEARDRHYYLNSMRGNSGIELIFNSRATKETLLVFYAPVYFDKQIIGSLLGVYKATKNLDKLLDMDIFGYRAEAWLCDSNGIVIASNHNIDTTREISITSILEARMKAHGGEGGFIDEGDSRIIPLKDNEAGACVMKLKNFDWRVVQIFPEEANQMMVAKANRLGIALAAFLVAILSILLFLTYRILNQARKETHAALVQAEAASRAKTEFLFNMSHDLRTPMNAIIGFLRLLGEHHENLEKRKEYIGKMEASSGLLLSMINNVLEMSRLEHGSAELEETRGRMDQTLESVCAMLERPLREKGLEFEKRIDGCGLFVWFDQAKVEEIFLNILNNACKYTPKGGMVSLRLAEIPANEKDHVQFKVEIEDNGVGIAPEFLPHIFEAFAREKNTTTCGVAGAGLGLAISKKLVELLGGSLRAESEVGKGSKFSVILSFRIAEEQNTSESETEIRNETFSGKRILLAEDNDFNADIAAELLMEAGFQVERARDGAICIAMLEQADDGYYDLILMDIQMPNMNGYQATAAIRKMDNLSKASITIIAMTANTFEEDKKKACAAGVDAHLGKPIDIRNLIKTLKSFSEG